MNATSKPQTIRIEYSLPSTHRSPLAGWQQNESTQYADDRAHQARMNRAELLEKAKLGLIRRRAH